MSDSILARTVSPFDAFLISVLIKMWRILVIEDEHAIADFLVRGLGEDGFNVERAADGEQGKRLLDEGQWDMVLLDWWLPHIDGFSLLKRFRSSDKDTPVLFLTARDSVSDRVRALDAGADDYLCKPFSYDELLSRINALQRRQKRGTALELKYCDVRLEQTTQRVTRAGRLLSLTAREYVLLSLFLRHPEDVLSKSRIYELAWDESYDGLSNTLEVHIMEIRKKLEAHGPRLIHTIRGRGYRLGRTEE